MSILQLLKRLHEINPHNARYGQYSSEYNFPAENLNKERIKQIIDMESQKARNVPDLTNVKAYIAGAKRNDCDRFFRIKNFWIATLMNEDYGAAMIDL